MSLDFSVNKFLDGLWKSLMKKVEWKFFIFIKKEECNDRQIKAERYVTDKKGHKVAAILDMKELSRIKELIIFIRKWLQVIFNYPGNCKSRFNTS